MTLRSSAPFVSFVCFVVTCLGLRADPLTKQQDIDFGRDVASRNLKGLAARSDGRLLPGPVFTDLTGPKLGDILWTLKPAGPNRFLVGTGPDGKVQEVTFNPADSTYTVREVADVDETHAISLLALPDGALLVGTSPTAALYVVKDGKAVARVPLPADSVFDLLALPDGTVLAATGNPGKIYKVDLKKLAAAGLIAGKVDSDALLADRGVTLFGEIRDRNVRRLARLASGRIVAGSSPKGNVYSFPAAGGAPLFLQENRDAEVVDLLPADDGSFHAAFVFTPGDALRLASKPPENKDGDRGLDRPEPKPAFTGRSTVVRFPADGFPETIIGKANISFYRLARHGDLLLLTAGEQGDAFGYDAAARRSMIFAGSSSAQLNDLAPLGDGRFLLLRNNAPGLALMAFNGAAERTLETKRLDLSQASDLGAVRLPRLRGLALADLRVETSTSYGNDELEGWSPWTKLTLRDEGFVADAGLRGRFVRYRFTLPGTATDFQVDKAVQFYRPQNRRPTLSDFRVFPANQGIIPAVEQPGNAVATISQMLFPNQRDGKDDSPEKRRGSFLNSQVIPQTGVQAVYWNVNDPDGDTLAYTFAIRPDGKGDWTDLAVETTDSYVQFETSGLAEGLYLTRLTVAEQAPRPASQRLTYTFETDTLLIDRTPPVIATTKTERAGGQLTITVTGRDALSLLEGAEFVLNNGQRAVVMHPVDGLLDGHEEAFRAEFPDAQAAGATSVEVILYDQTGNASSTRLSLK